MTDIIATTELDRRAFFSRIIGAAAVCVGMTAMTTAPAEAKRGGRGGGRRGAPPGWSRGRKRGWAKRGGPKWRW